MTFKVQKYFAKSVLKAPDYTSSEASEKPSDKINRFLEERPRDGRDCIRFKEICEVCGIASNKIMQYLRTERVAEVVSV